ncbi:MAG: hypothetical protein IPM24_12995 [Bryobacterales bacterium]|jgi:hypothetical protein|nr:hypothetical protein [Bryobacterales bacterium]
MLPFEDGAVALGEGDRAGGVSGPIEAAASAHVLDTVGRDLWGEQPPPTGRASWS